MRSFLSSLFLQLFRNTKKTKVQVRNTKIISQNISGSKIVINGISYVGNNISSRNGKILIDGKEVEIIEKEIFINVNGNINLIDVGACKEFNVLGNVDQIRTGSGDVKCGDVTGSVKTASGSVDCRDIGGNVETSSGTVKANEIKGNVKTISGSIKR